MACDFTSQRLFVDAPLAAGGRLALEKAQVNYLLNVLRLRDGAAILVFNGRDGEWRAEITEAGRKAASLRILEQTRPQSERADLDYLFAPLKQARLDYMVEKAVEMGVGRLRPVFTQHTQVSRVNLDRMRANSIEAAEQCGILALPEIEAPEKLDAVLAFDPPGAAGEGVVKLNGSLIRLAVEAGEDLIALRNGPVAFALAPEEAADDHGEAVEATLVFEIEDRLRVGYGGYYECLEAPGPH